jgi:hypothetical protein
MLINARKKRLKTERRVAARLAALNAGAEEQYFEEKRALIAYPLLKTDAKWRALGAFLIVSGCWLIYEAFYG